jgi:DNA (cytosine-5)-methyltransferase 1
VAFAVGAGGAVVEGAGMNKLRVLDLFSGIGGFSLGLERTGGFETVAFCEIEPFPRKVLRKHWPEVPIYEDVRTLTGDVLARDGIAKVDVITGGFPCQDLSSAGKRAGIGEGTRSGLYAEVLRLAGDLRPDFIILENVANLLSGPSERRGRWFGRVLGDLAECGYDAEWENIPASALGAPHRRERIWVVAYPAQNNDAEFQDIYRSRKNRFLGHGCPHVANADSINEQGKQSSSPHAKKRARPILGSIGPCSDVIRQWQIEPCLGRVADGVPDRSHRLAGLGNAVVPQIPELIGRAILAAEIGGNADAVPGRRLPVLSLSSLPGASAPGLFGGSDA